MLENIPKGFGRSGDGRPLSRSESRAGKTIHQGMSQRSAEKPTRKNIFRQPKRTMSHATTGAPRKSPARVPLSKIPDGRPRSRGSNRTLTIFVPPGR